METSKAILLRKRKLSDTSLVITWYAESLGRIDTAAKGARRPKSIFAGKLDLFFETEIQIARSRKSSLHTLTEAVLRNPFAGIRANYLRTQTASYFVELIELGTEPEHPAPEFSIYCSALLVFLTRRTPACARCTTSRRSSRVSPACMPLRF